MRDDVIWRPLGLRDRVVGRLLRISAGAVENIRCESGRCVVTACVHRVGYLWARDRVVCLV